MRTIITQEYGEVKLGSTVLPGIFEAWEIDDQVKVDEMWTGGSGKSKQPLGFEDATLTLRLRLLTDEKSTCYDKLQVIARVFKATDKQAKPFIYRIVSMLTSAYGIREVIFAGLNVAENNENDTLRASLSFTEHRPVLIRKEAQVKPKTSSTGTIQGFAESGKTKTTKSLVTSPAVDDDKVS
ncbi:MAG: hypothetical protein M1379_00950 [Firmicutes bacterium]|nr:hypothetical protein [Bacillota bacterium]